MQDLARSLLGRTGLEVSRLGYGSMELRHTGTIARPNLDEATAATLLNAAIDGGITYIDTSPTYGPAEELIGTHLSARRADFTLATKTGFVIDELPARRHVFTKEIVRTGLEWSLRRLKTDYVDVVQLPGNPTPAELVELGTLEELEALRAEGKCRFIGISGWSPQLAEHIDWGAFDVFQIPYSALERENEDLIGEAARAGFGTVVRGGVAQGVMSAVSRMGAGDPGDRAVGQRATWDAARLDDLLDGATPNGFMIRYLLSNADVGTAIVGTADPDHLLDNLAAAELGPLARDVHAEAQRRLNAAA